MTVRVVSAHTRPTQRLSRTAIFVILPPEFDGRGFTQASHLIILLSVLESIVTKMASESTSMQSDGPVPPTTLADPVDAFLAYPFATDAVYQVRIPTHSGLSPDDEPVTHKQGLDSIVASGAFEGKSEEERAALVRSSQVFYFTRSAATQASSRARGWADGLIAFTALRAARSPSTRSSSANARGGSQTPLVPMARLQ